MSQTTAISEASVSTTYRQSGQPSNRTKSHSDSLHMARSGALLLHMLLRPLVGLPATKRDLSSFLTKTISYFLRAGHSGRAVVLPKGCQRCRSYRLPPHHA